MNKDFFKKGVVETIEESSVKKKLASGKKLRIKYGVDPTRPDIHLGHAVAMWKLKELQDEGHIIIFLIGDYTTKIGDPSGRSTARPILSDAEIKQNAKTYFDQVGKILDVKKTEVRYNSEWYAKMSFNDILQIAGKFTVAGIIERDDFSNRLKKGIDVGLHELLYPLMQAYDSVVLEADIAFCGTDQKFNELAGRELQKKMGQTPQDIIMVKLLVGLDGKEKMSKSLNNYIGITEDANSMFGKVMSIPDSLINEYFELCTDVSAGDMKKYDKQMNPPAGRGTNPRDIKAILAAKIVELYHDKKSAEKAKEEFFKVFSKKELPTDIPEIKIKGTYALPLFLIELGASGSNSEARRLIEQGALKIDGTKITDPKSEVTAHPDMIVQVGKKKFYRIK
ncbi:MAG: tyrosine--tRNA ligase [Patescibacteria group bacterium]|nr:tyrosine--tRNA ligase [Patescibacteria group bacterium]